MHVNETIMNSRDFNIDLSSKQHFRDCKSLDVKLQELLDTACHEPTLTSSEKRVIMEVSQ